MVHQSIGFTLPLIVFKVRSEMVDSFHAISNAQVAIFFFIVGRVSICQNSIFPLLVSLFSLWYIVHNKKSRCYDINVIRQVTGYVDAPATLSYGSRTPSTCTTSLVRDFVSVRDKSKSSLADQKKLVRSVGQSGAAAARTKWKGRCWRPTAPGDKEPQQITINKRITISSWHVEVPLQL